MNADTPTARAKPAEQLAAFTSGLRLSDVPASVRHRAKLQILDALGVALASSGQNFADATVAAALALGDGGVCSVIGRRERLHARDAALANGVLVHGLDFDDTHLASIVHPTAACLPCALSLGEALGASGEELLTAYVAGMETAIRIGLAVDGGFHHVGFHATGIASHFSSAVVAARLLGLDATATVSAQGIAASTASGVQVFLEEGAWTKRLHPGWGAVAGITAAQLARAGFRGPSRPYEGRFGLFETHLQQLAGAAKLRALADGLGKTWHLADTAIKPYPVCHFIHGCADAAIALSTDLSGGQIESVEISLPEQTLPIVAEPAGPKRRPSNEYEAKFSAPYVVATCLLKGGFGLSDLLPAALGDEAVLALAARTECRSDPQTAFPVYFSGGVSVRLRDGRVLTRHVRVNSGAGERALDEHGVGEKFMAAATMSVPEAQAQRVREVVLHLEDHDVGVLTQSLRAED